MNLDWLHNYDPVLLALFATLFTWAVTALGSSMVFFLKVSIKGY
jgi:ZIP family zinc transporter